MLTGLRGDTPSPIRPIRQDAGGLTLRLGCEMGAVPAEQGRDIVAVLRARNSAVTR